MTTRTIQNEFVGVKSAERLSWLEKYALKRFHPRKLFIDSIALIWATYFLWRQDWQGAAVVTIVVMFLGLISVWGTNADKMAQTTLGKVALLHLNPFNFFTQLIGLVPLVYGIWTHSVEIILIGFSLILLGHIFGWPKVDSKFSVIDNRNR